MKYLSGNLTDATLTLGASSAQAQTTINAVYFGQPHALKATDSYFGLMGNREAPIKMHVVKPTTPASHPFFPASGPATRSFNGLHPKANSLAVNQMKSNKHIHRCLA